MEEALRSTKCNLNAFDTRGFAFIHWAACYGFTECVEVLVRCGADITLQTLVSLANRFHLKDERSAYDVAVDYEKKGTAEWIQFTASEVIVCFLVNDDPKDFFNAITNGDKNKPAYIDNIIYSKDSLQLIEAFNTESDLSDHLMLTAKFKTIN